MEAMPMVGANGLGSFPAMCAFLSQRAWEHGPPSNPDRQLVILHEGSGQR